MSQNESVEQVVAKVFDLTYNMGEGRGAEDEYFFLMDDCSWYKNRQMPYSMLVRALASGLLAATPVNRGGPALPVGFEAICNGILRMVETEFKVDQDHDVISLSLAKALEFLKKWTDSVPEFKEWSRSLGDRNDSYPQRQEHAVLYNAIFFMENELRDQDAFAARWLS